MRRSGQQHNRRIVVTGIGLVTPLGLNAKETFRGVVEGRSGLVPLHKAPFFLPGYIADDKRIPTASKASMLQQLVAAMPGRVVGAVIEDTEYDYYYDMESKDSVGKRRRLQFAPTPHEPRGFRFCARAVEEALQDALLLHPSAVAASPGSALIGIDDPTRVGVNIGMGIPSLSDVTDVAAHLTHSLVSASSSAAGQQQPHPADASTSSRVHYSKINPFFVPKILGNMAAGVTAIKYNCQGFISSSVAACATGAHCIGESFLVMREGDAASRSGDAAAFAQFLQQQRRGDATSTTPATTTPEKAGVVDVMICGATEACITPVSVGGFSRMRALSTRRNDPTAADGGEGPATASRPFDVSRDGFVMSEGAGILILEEYAHAHRRIQSYMDAAPAAARALFDGKTPEDFMYGEVKGFGVSSDAHHVAAPHPDGRGAETCLRACLRSAGLLQDPQHPSALYVKGDGGGAAGEGAFSRFRVGYVNAHATGTIGDEIEMGAIRRVLGSSPQGEGGAGGGRVVVSSTKGSLGHLLGAAGSVEAAVALLAMKENVAPPTANLKDPCLSAESQRDDNILLNAEATALSPETCDGVISTSFGFGGINTALLFSRIGSTSSAQPGDGKETN
uniref:beta-ketoacyl-[acyl-carrier-protein] synthase I n=1 Tax=Herpetomonas muscarum TaxID=5718 RepID=T1YTC4_HERMU|nr:beta-ketoacyl-acyl-carrier-protein synthase I [Herpetomonas muscarum]